MRPGAAGLVWLAASGLALASAAGEARLSRHWRFLGPFPVGKQELDGDPTAAFGGISTLLDDGVTVPSELVPGGRVGWTRLPLDQNGRVMVQPGVEWNQLLQSLSSVAVLEFQGWAIGKLQVSQAGRFAVLCSSVHSFEIANYTLLHGDIYNRRASGGASDGWAHLSLGPGAHQIRIRVRGRAQASFSCQVKSAPGKIQLSAPRELPDLVGGRLSSTSVRLGLLNHQSSWARVQVRPVASAAGLVVGPVDLAAFEVQIAPGQLGFVDAALTINSSVVAQRLAPVGERENCAKAEASIEWELPDGSRGVESVSFFVRCRKPTQSFLFTFRDSDGSVSVAAAIAPRRKCARACGVVLSLSGVGVSPQNQADAYKYMSENGDWLFGFETAWVLAPERAGAHNWEGHGQATAVASLVALSERVVAWKHLHGSELDRSRLVITGHSRGGHGAWLLASHMPDAVLAAAPASGWLRREAYGDANLVFDKDVSLSHLDPQLQAILTSTLMENNVELHAPHFSALPVLARVGSADNSVPPYLTRRMVRLVQEHGGPASLSELTGKPHWWWDSFKTNDGGTMNDPEMRRFVTAALDRPAPPLPEKFELIVTSPAALVSRGGLQPLQVVTPFRLARAQVTRVCEPSASCDWRVTSTNLCRVRVVRAVGALQSRDSLWMDGQQVDIVGHDLLNPATTLCRPCEHGRARWRTCLDGEEYQQTGRGPANVGPARRVFSAPFLVVQGSGAKQAAVNAVCEEVALWIANGHTHAAETSVRMILDHQLDAATAEAHNLVLVGGPEANSWTTKLAGSMSIFNSTDSFAVGPCSFGGAGLGLVSTLPHWDSTRRTARRALVVAGTDADGLRTAVRFSFSMSQELTRPPLSNMVADYAVYGPETAWKGYGGLLAAGYWGNKWEWRSDAGFIQC